MRKPSKFTLRNRRCMAFDRFGNMTRTAWFPVNPCTKKKSICFGYVAKTPNIAASVNSLSLAGNLSSQVRSHL